MWDPKRLYEERAPQITDAPRPAEQRPVVTPKRPSFLDKRRREQERIVRGASQQTLAQAKWEFYARRLAKKNNKVLAKRAKAAKAKAPDLTPRLKPKRQFIARPFWSEHAGTCGRASR